MALVAAVAVAVAARAAAAANPVAAVGAVPAEALVGQGEESRSVGAAAARRFRPR